MSAAYVVLAHKQPEQVARLCRALAPAPVFLHVDTAAGEFGHPSPNAWPVPRHRSAWASWGIVEAILEGMRAAAPAPGWTHLAILSGQDYPLAPPDEIAAFLAGHAGRSFMARWPLPARLWGRDGGLHRVRYRHWAVRGRRVFLPLRRRLPEGIEPWGGSMYACLARAAVEQVLSLVDARPDVVRFYRRSWIPDEMFVPTAVMNSPARTGVLNESLSYIGWSGGAHPDLVRATDLPALERAAHGPSDVGGHGRRKLFARKLDVAVDPEIFDLIDESLLQGAKT
jgi:hypothetical protein